MKPFLIDYEHDGRRFSATVEAADLVDAEARLESLRQTGRVEGELLATVDGPEAGEAYRKTVAAGVVFHDAKAG